MKRHSDPERRIVYSFNPNSPIYDTATFSLVRRLRRHRNEELRDFPNDCEITVGDRILVPMITDGTNRIVPLSATFECDPLLDDCGPSFHIPLLGIGNLKRKLGAVYLATVRKIIVTGREIARAARPRAIEYTLGDVTLTESLMDTCFFRDSNDLVREERHLLSHGVHLVTFVRRYLPNDISAGALQRLPLWDEQRASKTRTICCGRTPDYANGTVRRRVFAQLEGAEPMTVPV